MSLIRFPFVCKEETFPTLLELAGYCVQEAHVSFQDEDIPVDLKEYLSGSRFKVKLMVQKRWKDSSSNNTNRRYWRTFSEGLVQGLNTCFVLTYLGNDEELEIRIDRFRSRRFATRKEGSKNGPLKRVLIPDEVLDFFLGERSFYSLFATPCSHFQFHEETWASSNTRIGDSNLETCQAFNTFLKTIVDACAQTDIAVNDLLQNINWTPIMILLAKYWCYSDCTLPDPEYMQRPCPITDCKRMKTKVSSFCPTHNSLYTEMAVVKQKEAKRKRGEESEDEEEGDEEGENKKKRKKRRLGML